MIAILSNLLQNTFDFIYSVLPQPKPQKTRDQVHLISHRGEHRDGRTKENTLASFRRAASSGVWGIEFDIRMTRDGQIVVHHDRSLKRVFGQDVIVEEIEFAHLRELCPEIPTLQEVVEEFGGRLHLMVEVKHPHLQKRRSKKSAAQASDSGSGHNIQVASVLSETLIAGIEHHLHTLRPGLDFHLISMYPEFFVRFTQIPRIACLGIAITNTLAISHKSLELRLGGIAGHFVLVHKMILQTHKAAGQAIGTGFPTSRRALWREVNRNVDWIFTNHAVKLQGIVDKEL